MLYLCRHGETEWSLSGQHTGTTDIPLTEKGREQSRLLQQRLQGVRFEKVFSSPRKRALATCEGLEVTIDPHLAEWNYGDYEGLTSKEISAKKPGWNLFKDGAPNGETPEQVRHRADEFLKRISQYKGNIAVFSHGHFLRVLAARFLGLEVDAAKLFLLSVGSCSILGHEREQPVITLWNCPSDQKGSEPFLGR
jgi:probable phosphoglycerate mutase